MPRSVWSGLALLVRLGQRLSPDERGLLAHLAVFRSPAPQDAWPEAAAALAVSPSTVRRLIKAGQLSASQLCKGAPWIIKAADLERPAVKGAATARRLRRPPSADPLQKVLEL